MTEEREELEEKINLLLAQIENQKMKFRLGGYGFS